MGAGPTRALTGGRRTKPTSTGCRRLRQPEPGRRSTYQAGEPVQTNRASSSRNCPLKPFSRVWHTGTGFEGAPMLVGYARVSTREQNHALQLDALHAAGCGRVCTEKASGTQRDRPELKAALDYAREGDTLVVWKLDRLARSIRQLIETVEDLERRKVGLRSLTEAIDTTTCRAAGARWPRRAAARDPAPP